jgi:hypothetical protein
MAEKIRNRDLNWDWPPGKYIDPNYGEGVITEDRRLGRHAVTMLKEHSTKLGTAKRALHIGMGGVPIGSAYIAPFMDLRSPDTEIVMGDIGPKKLEVARQTIAALRMGQLGIWAAHQDNLNDADSLGQWKDAFRTAGRLGNVTEFDMHTLDQHEGEFDIGVAEHVFESATEDPEEYYETVEKFYHAVAKGGLVVMSFMIESSGYTVAGRPYPAYPVTGQQVAEHAQAFLDDIQLFTTGASNQAREEGDNHVYGGMGVMVATVGK